MKKYILIIILTLLVMAVAIFIYLRSTAYREPIWKTAIIDTGTVSVNVTATGSLNPVNTVQVGAQVSGIVAKLYVDFNSEVKKNQVIARLDTVLLEASMRDAYAAVQKAKVNVELTKRQYIRADTLYHQNVAAKSDFDVAYAGYKAAEADLVAATATYDHERINMHYATIRAPINGTVINRNVDVGQTVISSFNAPILFSIAKDLKEMQVLANVDEADIGIVKVGQHTEFTVDAYPYEVFRGNVAQIRLQPTMIQNVNNYIVVINVANPDLKLLPGLTATTTIKIQEDNNVLRVPINALHFTPSADYFKHVAYDDSIVKNLRQHKVAGNEVPKTGALCYIWLNKGVNLQPVLVKAGLFDGTYMEVSGNLQAADVVVTGINTTGVVQTTSNNPFMPQMKPQPKK